MAELIFSPGKHTGAGTNVVGFRICVTFIGGPKPNFSHLQRREKLLPDNLVGQRVLPKLGRFHEILHSETFLGDRLGLAQRLSQGGLNGRDET